MTTHPTKENPMSTTHINDGDRPSNVPAGHIQVWTSEDDWARLEAGTWDGLHPGNADCRRSAVFEHSTGGYSCGWVDPTLWHALSCPAFGVLGYSLTWHAEAHRDDDGALVLEREHRGAGMTGAHHQGGPQRGAHTSGALLRPATDLALALVVALGIAAAVTLQLDPSTVTFTGRWQ